jgi:phosphorylcholine metabolism protein LicD
MKKTLTLNDFPRTSQNILTRLYEQIALIHTVCDKYNITYWLIGGSLLGQIRHNSIIPWDDDTDVGIFVEDKNRLKELLLEAGKRVEMTVWDSVHGLKLKCLRNENIGTDLFIYHKNKINWNGKFIDAYVLASDRSRKEWPNDYFLVNEVTQELITKSFGPNKAVVPNDPTRYLNNLYGANWNSVAKLDYNHMDNCKHVNAGIPVPLNN